uniref:Peptidase C14 caspase domain-containing protein n=1 Tax=Chromera velia CCMP2878 TaxID=1169474 RepID=A0A0G4I7B4_9ALVE|eukprot:Cvel_11624.t1-p1 / transcript=Cvel_11624.t1 / gene=Cvel_11624 / organism=Chromera_velia_CCMP2878 / gene_product=hypothetical protein / transcript_product=hypothetical protein / location=Cvel_scaffold736:33477-41195(-) / protein_length=1371 / sequence_SO=supercontig / SO=protein_coding / is_pseudo=false
MVRAISDPGDSEIPEELRNSFNGVSVEWHATALRVLVTARMYAETGIEGLRAGCRIVVCNADKFLKRCEGLSSKDPRDRRTVFGGVNENEVFSHPEDVKTDLGAHALKKRMNDDGALIVDGVTGEFRAYGFRLKYEGGESSIAGGLGTASAEDIARTPPPNGPAFVVVVSEDGRVKVFSGETRPIVWKEDTAPKSESVLSPSPNWREGLWTKVMRQWPCKGMAREPDRVDFDTLFASSSLSEEQRKRIRLEANKDKKDGVSVKIFSATGEPMGTVRVKWLCRDMYTESRASLHLQEEISYEEIVTFSPLSNFTALTFYGTTYARLLAKHLRSSHSLTFGTKSVGVVPSADFDQILGFAKKAVESRPRASLFEALHDIGKAFGIPTCPVESSQTFFYSKTGGSDARKGHLPCVRVAVVIGVSDYGAHNGGGDPMGGRPVVWHSLSGTRKDAEGMRKKLMSLSFDAVCEIQNAHRWDLKASRGWVKEKLFELKAKRDDLSQGAAVVFYFAGHGYEHAAEAGEKKQYLVPLDWAVARDVELDTLVTDLSDAIEAAWKNSTLYVILDCCRKETDLHRGQPEGDGCLAVPPFAAALSENSAPSVATDKAGRNQCVFFGFATEAGKAASGTITGGHFTQCLLSALNLKRPFPDVFREATMKSSGGGRGAQIPWMTSSSAFQAKSSTLCLSTGQPTELPKPRCSLNAITHRRDREVKHLPDPDMFGFHVVVPSVPRRGKGWRRPSDCRDVLTQAENREGDGGGGGGGNKKGDSGGYDGSRDNEDGGGAGGPTDSGGEGGGGSIIREGGGSVGQAAPGGAAALAADPENTDGDSDTEADLREEPQTDEAAETWQKLAEQFPAAVVILEADAQWIRWRKKLSAVSPEGEQRVQRVAATHAPTTSHAPKQPCSIGPHQPCTMAQPSTRSQNLAIRGQYFVPVQDETGAGQDAFGNPYQTSRQLMQCSRCGQRVIYYQTATLGNPIPAWLESHLMVCEELQQHRNTPEFAQLVAGLAAQRVKISKRGLTNKPNPTPASNPVCEVLFECYAPEASGPGINQVLIPEDFLTQLDSFPPECGIQVVDLHGPSFDVVDRMLDRFLQELNLHSDGGANMLESSLAYLESREKTPFGYPMRSGSSRYKYANRAVIYTYQHPDNGYIYKLIFRVCPHIMQSQIASALIYCPPQTPLRSDGQTFENWEGRLFADAGSFGKALLDCQTKLGEELQLGAGGYVEPLWKKQGKVFFAFNVDVPMSPQFQWDANRLKEALRVEAGLSHPVEQLIISPPHPSNTALASSLQELVKSSFYISFHQGGGEAPVGGKDLGNFIRLCFAGFMNGFRNFQFVKDAHRALLKSHILDSSSTIIHFPEPAEKPQPPYPAEEQ